MRRFLLLLRNEFALFRTAIPAHAVAALQPAVLYLLMTTILVHPTFDMNMARPETVLGAELAAALEQVGSPVGEPYVRLAMVDWNGGTVDRQVIRVEALDSGSLARPVAVQHFGLIDSNLVKNFRNRLTAAALRLWDAELGPRSVTVEQHPWLPHDVPYNVYFGMAVLPMATFLAAAIIGAMLTAQEFEFRTVVEYRLAPATLGLILGGRLVRLALTALLSAGVVWLAVGLVTGVWPRDPWLVVLILLPVAVVAGCVGMTAALLLRRTIPAFLVGLVGAFAGWIVGGAFGLPSSFGATFERVSRLTPFAHAIELLFPRYFGDRSSASAVTIGSPVISALVLLLMAAGMVALTAMVYQRRVRRQE